MADAARGHGIHSSGTKGDQFWQYVEHRRKAATGEAYRVEAMSCDKRDTSRDQMARREFILPESHHCAVLPEQREALLSLSPPFGTQHHTPRTLLSRPIMLLDGRVQL